MTGIQYDSTSPVATLRALTEDTWNSAVTHRFVRELFDDSIANDTLAKYLVQDYQFFESFLSMLGACVAHADTLSAKLRFAQQLGMLSSDEDTYFQDSFATLGVSDEQWQDPTLTETTSAFCNEMDLATETADYPRLLVVLVIAEWLYLEWGESDLGEPARPECVGWVELHRGEAFREWVQFLVDELNRVFPQGDEDLAHVWERVVNLELSFFNEAYV